MMRPVTIAVTGGFGNQLFQFAAARALAHGTGRRMASCFRMYDAAPLRRAFVAARSAVRLIGADRDERFRLAAMVRRQDISAVQSEAPPTDHTDDRRQGFDRRSLKRAFVDPSYRIPGSRILRECDEVTAACVGSMPIPPGETPLIAGFMAGDRFVGPQIDELRGVIRLPRSSPYCAGWIRRLADRTTVGVHVRRGDYLKPAYAKTFPLVPAWWFGKAATIAAERAGGDVRFAVFTDEPAWAREHLRLPGETVVVSGDGPASGLEDFTVLASCAHHVISNSTFGWWAARLAAGGGTVVAPTRWLVGREPPPGFMPSTWVTLENPDTRGHG